MIHARAVKIREPGGPEVLTLGELDVRDPGPGEVRVRVRAAGLNRADVMQRRGFYPAPPGVPADVPGLEYAGEIESVDSSGVFEDDACCYSVTKRDSSFFGGCFDEGIPPGTSVTTVGATTGGTGGAGGAGGTGGAGGSGGNVSCTRCAEAISGGDTSNLCPSSQELFDLLSQCMCQGACAGSCAPECSGGGPASMGCQQCLTDLVMGCGTPFDACANDV